MKTSVLSASLRSDTDGCHFTNAAHNLPPLNRDVMSAYMEGGGDKENNIPSYVTCIQV
jgi:hypothetical protein